MVIEKVVAIPTAVPMATHKQSIGFLMNDTPSVTTPPASRTAHAFPVAPVVPVSPVSPVAVDGRRQSAAAPPRRRCRTSCAQCRVCARSFGEAFAARKHFRVVHLKQNAHCCRVCHRRFAERSNLKKHIVALHQHTRSHPCDTCGKTFSFSDGLRRHVNNRHLGLRPYSCDRCAATFKQRTHLQKHLTSVYELDPAVVTARAGPSSFLQAVPAGAGRSEKGDEVRGNPFIRC